MNIKEAEERIIQLEDKVTEIIQIINIQSNSIRMLKNMLNNA